MNTVLESVISLSAMDNAAAAYADEMQEKAYRMSSCGKWHETMRCHACVIENQLCTRVNTIPSFQEANRLLPHNLAEFDLHKLGNFIRSKVCVFEQCLLQHAKYI